MTMLSSRIFSKKVLVGLLCLFFLTTLVTAALILSAAGDDNMSEGTIADSRGIASGEELAGLSADARSSEALPGEVAEPATPDFSLQIQRLRPVTVRTATETRTLFTMKSTLGSFLQDVGVVVGAGETIVADGEPVPAEALSSTTLPELVEIGKFVTISIVDGTQRQLIHTSAIDVGGALDEAGIVLNSADGVVPDLREPLRPGLHIVVQRAFPLTVLDGDTTLQIRSHETTVIGALADAGIQLFEQDYTVPAPDAGLKPNDVIRIVRVTEDFRVIDEPIPYQTIWQPTSELSLDAQAIISQGVDGIWRQRIRVRHENGVEISQTVDSEWAAVEPVNEVVGYGTRIELGLVDTPEGTREFWRVVRMRATSYTAASSGKSPSDPDYGVTASGRPAGFGVVAIDRNIVPFGSTVYVPGYGIGFAGDTGGGVRGRWIDLGYEEENFVSWSGYVDVYYLTPVPPPEDINYLLPAAPP